MKTLIITIFFTLYFKCLAQEIISKDATSYANETFFSEENIPKKDENYYSNKSIEITNINITSNAFYTSKSIRLIAGENGLKNSLLESKKTIVFSIVSNEINFNSETISNVSSYNITLFPNPASTNVTVKWNSQGIKKISLLSMEGKVLLEKSCDPNLFFIDLNVESYPIGIYSVLLYSKNNQIFHCKLIKKG